MTDIDVMIVEAWRGFDEAYYDHSTSFKEQMKAAISTIAPLELLAGVKAGTHKIVREIDANSLITAFEAAGIPVHFEDV